MKIEPENVLSHAPLGKRTGYIDQYDPSLLFPIPRKLKRDEIGIRTLPFHGYDLWTAFELSWLNTKGMPQVRIAEFRIPCESVNLIESKSFKLYLNSFNQSKFKSETEVRRILKEDLSRASGADVLVEVLPITSPFQIDQWKGTCLDHQDLECEEYLPNPNLIQIASEEIVSESFYSDLLKSNCLVTGQPDWGSVLISYTGKKINLEGLLKYLISFRGHNEFHEQCVERIFVDISEKCAPQELSVYARYTRRGGLDINPYRSTSQSSTPIVNQRLSRQ